MIILVTPEMSIIDYQFNSTSWSLFFIEKDKRNTAHCYLQTFDFLLYSISVNRIYVAQWEIKTEHRYNLHWKILCKPYSSDIDR